MNPKNKKLYQTVVSEAKSRFGTWPSAYASMWVAKTYMERGGKYNKKALDNKGTSRWLAEKWVNMGEYLKGNTVPCGEPAGKSKACRPLKRINKDTPITASEAVSKHGKPKIQRLVNAKVADQSGTRIDWVKGKVTRK